MKARLSEVTASLPRDGKFICVVPTYKLLVPTGRKLVKHNSVRSFALLGFRQLVRFVIGFAVELLNFFAKVRAVITIRVRKRPSLTLVIPIIGIQSLGFFEMR